VGFAVFVMTDVVGSTALWETHGDDMRVALEQHDRLLGESVAGGGGRIFKHTGDGMLAVFDTTDAAVATALDIVGALAGARWGPTGPLEVRVSVHAGQVAERDGDYFGPPLNKTARINGIGHAGQVLVSDVARQLMQPPRGVDLGEHQLRDLSEPVRLWQLDDGDHPPLRTLVRTRHNLPAMPTRFIGRDAEITELRRLVSGHRLVTVTGVGGCGKTRLAVEVGAACADRFPGGVWLSTSPPNKTAPRSAHARLPPSDSCSR
jgi:class 3 adenylate cyclase